MEKEKVIALDIGGTSIKSALVEIPGRKNTEEKIIKQKRKETPKTKKEFLKTLLDSINEILEKEKKIKRIGIACPGPLNANNGKILNPPNLPLKNFNLYEYLKNNLPDFKGKIKIRNDADCAALAEIKSSKGVGKRKKKNNFIVLTLGTGIGGGIVINNRVYNGNGSAGQLGHIVLNQKGKKKYLESLIGGKALKKTTLKEFGKNLKLNELIKRKDEKSKKIIDNISEHLSQGIASFINIFDPQAIILTGGYKETGEKFLKQVRKKVPECVLFTKDKIPEISWTKINNSGIIGAAFLAKE